MKLLSLSTSIPSRIMTARPRFPSVFRRNNNKNTNDGAANKRGRRGGNQRVVSPFQLSLTKPYKRSIISDLDESDMTKETVGLNGSTSSALDSSVLDNSIDRLVHESDDDDELVRLLSSNTGSDQSDYSSCLLDALQEEDDDDDDDEDCDDQSEEEEEEEPPSRGQEYSASLTRSIAFIDEQYPQTHSSLVTHIYTRPRTSHQENEALFYKDEDYVRFRNESQQEELCAALLLKSLQTSATSALTSSSLTSSGLSSSGLSSSGSISYDPYGFEDGLPWVLDRSSEELDDSSDGCSPCSSRRSSNEPQEQDDDQGENDDEEEEDSIWDNAILEDLTEDQDGLSLIMNQRMSLSSSGTTTAATAANNNRRPRSQARNNLHRQDLARSVLQHF